jgi:coenzyme F420-reducing hydrogenase delta subunit
MFSASRPENSSSAFPEDRMLIDRCHNNDCHYNQGNYDGPTAGCFAKALDTSINSNAEAGVVSAAKKEFRPHQNEFIRNSSALGRWAAED